MIPKTIENVKDSAHLLAAKGFPVFPCKPKQKTPATRHGFKNATTDAEEIEKLFRQNHNVAIATGPASNVWVLDLDGLEGIAAFDRWQIDQEPIPETATAKTGGGGRHLFFRLNGEDIRNRTKIDGFPIDARGEGGYVIAPPSIHHTGNRYEWIVGPEHLADAPAWLVDRVTNEIIVSLPLENVVEVKSVDDLSTHPGSGEGCRHSDLLRLVGVELARGKPVGEIENAAQQWAARCNPSMPPAEAAKIVGDLSNREAKAVEGVPLPCPEEFPTLDERAFRGPIGELVKLIEPETEADPAALLISSIVCFGSVIGRHSRILVGATPHFGNEYAVIVGNTSSGRKGTGGDFIEYVFGEIDPVWKNEHLRSGGLSSGEGLIHALNEDNFDKRLLVKESEFVSVLKNLKREGNILGPVLRNAWDCKNLRTMTVIPRKVSEPHLSVIAHVTREELRTAISEAEVFGGTANRFLWCCSRRSKLLPEGGSIPDLSSVVSRIGKAVEFSNARAYIERSEAGRKTWAALYHRLARRKFRGVLAAATSRAEAHCLRLSMLYALLDQSEFVEPDHIEAAAAVWNYCEQSAKWIFGDTSTNPLQDRILAAIRQQPGIGRWELRQEVGKHHDPAKIVAQVAELRDLGLIRIEAKKTKGRSAETYYPLTDHNTLNTLPPTP